MEIELNTQDIQNIISIVTKVVGGGIGSNTQDTILLEVKKDSLTVSAVSFGVELWYEIKVQNKKEEKTVIALSAQTLDGVLSSILENNVTFSQDKNQLIIKTNNSKSVLNTQTLEEAMSLQEKGKVIKTIALPVSVVVDGIRSTQHAAATGVVKPELASVFLYTKPPTVYFVATDTHKLSEARYLVEGVGDFEVLLPNKNTQTIQRVLEGIGTKEVVVEATENGLFFSADSCVLFVRPIEGAFPDYKNLLTPKNEEMEFTALKSDLTNFFKKAKFFSNKLNKLSIKAEGEDQIALSFENDQTGFTEDMIPIADKKGSGPIPVFNYRFIGEALQAIKDDKIVFKFEGVGKPLILRGLQNTNQTELIAPLLVD